MSLHQPSYDIHHSRGGKHVQARCGCGWSQEAEDCGSQLRAYLAYADHLREVAVADSYEVGHTFSTADDRRAA